MVSLSEEIEMNKLLVINSGLFSEQSNSNKFTDMFLRMRAASGLADAISTHDFNAAPLPHLSASEMQAWMTPEQDRTEQQQELVKISDQLIDELFQHDLIVIGMPMYNMGIPSTFKAYIDRIARAGKTFKYTENGPQGLVNNKKVIVLAARGGQYQGTPLDSQTSYLQSIFGLMGITDIEFIYAEGLNMGEQVAQQAWNQAEQQLHALV
jgi:FMN-dependent NADH-azoreductase